MSIGISYVPSNNWGCFGQASRSLSYSYLFIDTVVVCRHIIIHRACQLACCLPQHLLYVITICYHEPVVLQKIKNSSYSYHAMMIIITLKAKWVFFYVSLYYCYYHHSTCDSCVLQYSIFSHNDCYNGPHLDGATSDTWSAKCGSTTTSNAQGHRRCFWHCHCAAVETSVPDASSGICSYAMVSFSFRVEPP